MTFIIIGAGGHGKVVADVVKSQIPDALIYFLDDGLLVGSLVMGISVIGTVGDCCRYPSAHFIIAIGDNQKRQEIAEKYALNYFTAIHPTAVIGSEVVIDQGTVIMANVVVNSAAKVGKHCIINTGAIIEHDNVIKNFVHISPGARLGGGVEIGNSTWIGIGATVKNNMRITQNCIVGAGAVVIKHIDHEGVYAGVPVRRINNENNSDSSQ